MLKIVDTLIIIAEQTGLIGEEKKQFVLNAFEDFKLGKIDNVEEYINDKVSLANSINVKTSLVNDVISETVLEIKDLEIEEENIYVSSLEKGNRALQNTIIEKDNIIHELAEQVNAQKTLNDIHVETIKELKEQHATETSEMYKHRSNSISLYEHNVELDKLKKELRLREEQLRRLRNE